jgi:outer membrane receptor protein involved in Fe transport
MNVLILSDHAIRFSFFILGVRISMKTTQLLRHLLYFRTDASLFYKRSNWKAQLNIRNLFDVEYFTSTSFGDRLAVIPGAPFTIIGTISVQF